MIDQTFYINLLLISQEKWASNGTKEVIKDLVDDLLKTSGYKLTYTDEEIRISITHLLDYLYQYEHDDGDDYEPEYNVLDVIHLTTLLPGIPPEPNKEISENEESQLEEAKDYFHNDWTDNSVSIDFNLTEEELEELIEYVKELQDNEAEMWGEEPIYPLIEKVGPTLKVTMP